VELAPDAALAFQYIPAGTFQMGSPLSEPWRETDEGQVSVTISRPFFMSRTEITQAQWTARMGSNPSLNQSASAEVPAGQVPNRPVERVTWLSIQGFLSATGMRLPTEAEWEYACRAGTSTAFHSTPGNQAGTNDDNLLGNVAWYAGNSGNQTRPVGQKAGNGFGLHDMSGNVFEWVDDWYAGNYYSQSPSTNPTGPTTGSLRVLRGGGWDLNSGRCRSACRYQTFPSNNGNVFAGFRVARNP
jgi:formylglycine-generating enzyme required for sulfatase activity